jgi:hypothetical protein
VGAVVASQANGAATHALMMCEQGERPCSKQTQSEVGDRPDFEKQRF